jgi:hypothetical protein
MGKTFLGKHIPEHKRPSVARRAKSGWFGLLVLPVLFAGGLLSLQKSNLTAETGPRTTGGALGRSLAATELKSNEQLAIGISSDITQSSGTGSAVGSAIGGAIGNQSTSGSTTSGTTSNNGTPGNAISGSAVPNPCTAKVVSDAFHSIRDKNHKQTSVSKNLVLFPFIPDGISGYDTNGKQITTMSPDEANKVCSQPFWGREVAYWFIYKALAILNWIATALAILLTLYAAVLYITGYASENNVKKAKSILTGAYIGLAIVFLAKVLVFAAVNIVSGQDPVDPSPPVELGS